ncbi:MAG: thioredoxin family protein [Planctomycetota bacterium]
MKRNSMINVAAICALLLITAACEPAKKAPALAFIPFSESAAADVQSEGKPAVVYATADWCPSCVQFNNGLLADTKIREELKNFTMLKIDYTHKDAETAATLASLEIDALPTLVIYDRDGKESRRIVGSTNRPFFIASLRGASEKK